MIFLPMKIPILRHAVLKVDVFRFRIFPQTRSLNAHQRINDNTFEILPDNTFLIGFQKGFYIKCYNYKITTQC